MRYLLPAMLNTARPSLSRLKAMLTGKSTGNSINFAASAKFRSKFCIQIQPVAAKPEAQSATGTQSSAACCGLSPVLQAAPDLQEEPGCVRSCPYRQTRSPTPIWESSDASGTLGTPKSGALGALLGETIRVLIQIVALYPNHTQGGRFQSTSAFWRSTMGNLHEIAYRIDPALWVRNILGVESTAWQ